MKIHQPPHSITVHILHDNTLTPDNRDKFIYLAGRYNQLVKFYNVDEICADKLQKIRDTFPKVIASNFSIATFYRFCIAQLLPADADKVIYLDSDVIVNLDIAELWRVELGDKVLGVIPEFSNYKSVEKMKAWNPIINEGTIEAEDYFNAGVLLINVNAFRDEEENIMRGLKWCGENFQYKYFDQDVLNYCFSTRTLKLPTKFNRLIKAARDDNEFIAKKKIYHYANGELQSDMSDAFNRLWMNYFVRTPWFDAETIGRLYAGFQQLHVSFKSVMANISAIMSGKTRTFFDVSRNIEALKKIFSVRDDEEIITAENDGLKKLLDAMNTSRGKKVFFIMMPNFPYQILIDAGFVFGKDFVNGMEFLSEVHGVPLDSYPLIKAM